MDSSTSNSTGPNSPIDVDGGGFDEECAPTTSQSQATSSDQSNHSGNESTEIEESFLLGERRIEIGKDHQAIIPKYNPPRCLQEYRLDEIEDEEDRREPVCLWSPPDPTVHDITEANIVSFCQLARQQCQFRIEQSLGILHYADFDIDQAVRSFDDYVSLGEEWSKSDKALFERAFASKGKKFRLVKNLIPHKKMGELIEHYYLWKNKRRQRDINHVEQMHRKKRATWKDEFKDNDSAEPQERETPRQPQLEPCTNCQTPYAQLQRTKVGMLCGTCFLYWKRTGQFRTVGSQSNVQQNFAPRSTNPSDVNNAVVRKRQEQLKKLTAELDDLRRGAQNLKTVANNKLIERRENESPSTSSSSSSQQRAQSPTY